MLAKVSIIGAGSVGATTAQRLAEKNFADIVLVDIIEGLPQGKALDIMESAPVLGFDARVTGANDYATTANSDLVVITSGLARKPGMGREELLQANARILTGVTEQVVKHSPDCVITVVTNPVDVMTRLVLRVSGFSPGRVLGLSGVLDGARLGSFIAGELGVSVTDVSTCVIGEHGKNMIVVPRLCTVAGVPLTRLLPPEVIDRLVARTVNGGAEIVDLLKTGSAFYAPSAAIVRMVEAILLDKKQIMPVVAQLHGEYGIRDAVISVPVKLGRAGIEEIIELELDEAEKRSLAASAEAVRKLAAEMDF